MSLLTNVYRWLRPARDPAPCDCGRPGVHRSWGQWFCDACEARRSADVWP